MPPLAQRPRAPCQVLRFSAIFLPLTRVECLAPVNHRRRPARSVRTPFPSAPPPATKGQRGSFGGNLSVYRNLVEGHVRAIRRYFHRRRPRPLLCFYRVRFVQAYCSTDLAHEVSSTSSCELPSWGVDRDPSPINSECTPQMSAGTRRTTMDNIMSAVLSSPLLEQPTVVSTGSGHVLVDACCPCLSSTGRHDRHDRRRRWMYRAPAAQGKEPIGEADTYDSDILVSNDAFSVACLLVKR